MADNSTGTRERLELPSPVTNVEDGKAALDEYGIAIHRGALSADQVDALKARLVEQADLERQYDVALISNQSFTGTTWYGGADGQLPAWQNVTLLVNKGRVFIDLVLKNPVMHEYCRHAFSDTPYQLSSMSGIIQRKGCEAMTIHSDQQWVPMLEMPVFLNFFFCLSDFEEQMGATRVVPKSHRRPPPQLGWDEKLGAYCVDEYETVPVECHAGDIFCWEGRTWHQSGASTSDKVRYNIACTWGRSWVKPIDNYLQSLQDDVYRTLSPEELDLLGFRVDAAGRIAPRYPGDRQSTNRAVPYIPELRPGADNVVAKAPGGRGNVDTFASTQNRKTT